MNNKKLLAAIVALTMSATTAVAFSGCNTDQHKHDFTDWTVTTPATCTDPGVETGTCKTDGVTDTREIPALGHDYGDWQISLPTATDKGSATKICANDAENEHPIEVELPVLGNEAYTVKKVKETPTYTLNQYTLAHDEGDIVFEATVSKDVTNTTLSVADAVETSNDPIYTALVGKGEGQTVTKTTRDSINEFNYEFGDNYTHVNIGDYEYWLEKDGDEISGIVFGGYDYRYANQNDEDYFSGMTFTNPFNGEKCVGPEELLDSLYFTATESADYNTEFAESVEGGVYSFSWTVVTSVFSDRVDAGDGKNVMTANTDTIYLASVEFTLDENYMLSSLELTYDKYNYVYELKETEDGSGIYVAKDALPYNFDEATKTYSPKDTDEPASVNTISVEQTALADLEKVPTNPWNLDEISVNGFDMYNKVEVSYDEYTETVADGENVVKQMETGFGGSAYYINTRFTDGATLTMATSEVLTIKLANFAPDKAKDYSSLNPVHVYLVVEGDDDILIAASDSWPWGTPISANYYQEELTLRSRENVGEFNIKICVGDAVHTFKLVVEKSAPEELVTNVDVYNASKDGYDVKKTGSITVYENQSFTFAVGVGSFEEDEYLCDPSSTVTLKEDYEGVTLTETDDGYSFVATKAGEYVINVVSTLDESVKTTLTVTVAEAPDVENEMLTGEYSAGDFTVSFDDGKVTVSDGADVNVEFGFTYANGVLTADSSDNKFSIELTENYNLVLVYVDEFNATNRSVLKAPSSVDLNEIKAALAGTWTGKYDYYYNITIIFNDNGTVEFNDSMMRNNAVVSYELVDNGNGTFAIIFDELSGDDWYDNYGTYYGLTANGSTVTVEAGSVTNLRLRVFDTASYDEGDFVATKQ